MAINNDVRERILERLKCYNQKLLKGQFKFKHKSQFLPAGTVEDIRLVFYRWWPRVEKDPIAELSIVSHQWIRKDLSISQIATEDLLGILNEYRNQRAMKNNTFKNTEDVKELSDILDNLKRQCIELLSRKHGYKFETNSLTHLPASMEDGMYACVTGGDGLDLTISYGADPNICWDPNGWVHDEVPESEEMTIDAWDLSVDDLIALLEDIEKAGYEEKI